LNGATRTLYDALLPHCSYRRLAVRLAYDWLRGSAALRPRLGRENWHYYWRYRQARFTCNVCGASGRPFFDFPDLKLRREHRIGELRETLQCRHCRATMRHRTLAAGLLRVVSQRLGRPVATIREAVAADMADLRILDSDALSPISALARSLPGYVISSFRPQRPFDVELEPRHYNVNLEQMGFPSAQFDLVLTSDVMEHVRDVDAAHAEIARVLVPGGVYVFTVPYDPECAKQHLLVDTHGREDRFLVPPQYHGDPLSGGILAYRVFGRALFDDLAALGFMVEFLDVDAPESLIVHGDVFIARKAAS
jgi:SAM-dependent methyltransferase